MQITKIDLSEKRNDSIIIKIDEINSFNVTLLKDSLIPYVHELHVCLGSVIITKKLTGLTTNNKDINVTTEQNFLKNVIDEYLITFDESLTFDKCFKFDERINYIKKIEAKESVINEELSIDEAIEVKKDKKNDSELFLKYLEELHASKKSFAVTDKDVWQIVGSLKAMFPNKTQLITNLVEADLQIANINVQSVTQLIDKTKPLDNDTAINLLNRRLKQENVTTTLAPKDVLEAYKNLLIEELKAFKCAVSGNYYLKLYSEDAEHTKWVIAEASKEIVLQCLVAATKQGLPKSKVDMELAISDRSNYPVKNYTREYIKENNLKWDGVDRFTQLGDYIKTNNQEFFAKYFSVWFVQCIKRYFNINYTKVKYESFSETALILKGEGGFGKSAVFKLIFPAELFINGSPVYDIAWYKFKWEDKDFTPLIGKICVVFEEINMKEKEGYESFKQQITSQDFDYRPMTKDREKRKQTFSFGCTTNDENFIYDVGGNRRFIVVDMSSLDKKFAYEFDFIQLFLQGLHLADNNWNEYKYKDEHASEVSSVAEQYSKGVDIKEIISTYFTEDATGKLKKLDIEKHLQGKGHFNINGDLLRNILKPHKAPTLYNGCTVYHLKIK